MTYNFRKAETKDQEQIYSLVKEVLSTYGLKTDPEETDKDILDLKLYYFNNNGWFEIIEDEYEKIIGSYGIIKISDTLCELRKMYLKKGYQGKGLGKEMMERSIQKAKELSYKEIILETNKVLIKAIGLYKKFGFKEFTPEHLSDRCDQSMILKI